MNRAVYSGMNPLVAVTCPAPSDGTRRSGAKVASTAVAAAVVAVMAALPAYSQADASGATDGSKKAAPAATASPAGEAKSPAALKSKASYAIGVSMGEQLHRAGLSPETVSVERLAQGLREALNGKATTSPEDRETMTALVKSVQEAAGAKNHAAAEKFLAENGKKPGVVTTPSGLQYLVITPGSGASPKPTDQVTVNYRGTLLDGTEFDSSYKRGQPATFPVNGIIPGWQEALVLMKPGAKWDIFIPPKLAYDLNSPPVIPPGSLLKFTVELISVKPAAPAPAPHPMASPVPPQTPK